MTDFNFLSPKDDRAAKLVNLNLQVSDFNNHTLDCGQSICVVDLGGEFAIQVTSKGLGKYPDTLQSLVNGGEIKFADGTTFPVISPEAFKARALKL